jgi:hypothetical protein
VTKRNKTQDQRARRASGVVTFIAWTIGLSVIAAGGFLVWVGMTGPEPIAPTEVAVAPMRVCPPVVSVPVRAINQPADDILGIRPGFTAMETEETVKCAAEDYEVTIEPATRSIMGIGAVTHPLMKIKRGEDEVYHVALFGPEGQERAGVIWRDQRFDVASGPLVQTLEGELVTKYGPPHRAGPVATGARQLTWSFGPDGKPIRKEATPGTSTYLQDKMTEFASGFTFGACTKNAHVDPAMLPAWDGRCGVTVRAEIEPSLSDKTRAVRLRMELSNQQIFARLAPQFRGSGAEDPAP